MPVYEATSFTSREEVESLLSQLGVELHVRDNAATLVLYYVSVGTSEVLFYLQYAATPVVLAQIPWVRRAATVAAALNLTGHGGEPMDATLLHLWERLETQLSMVLAKEASVPGLADVQPAQYGGGPVVVNRRIDPQFTPASLVVRPASMDTPAGYNQPADYTWPNGLPFRPWW